MTHSPGKITRAKLLPLPGAWRLLPILSLLAGPVFGGDVEDVIAATEGHYRNIQDAQAHIADHLPDHTAIGNGELVVSHSIAEQVAVLQAQIDAGVIREFQHRDTRVRILGDTAIVTGVLEGRIRGADGVWSDVELQRSAVLVRTPDGWKEAHAHASPLP